MIELKSNAKELVKKYCNQKEIRASFYETIEAVNKKYEVTFSDRMQKLITKIGLIMSECSQTTKIKYATFLGSVDFLCYKVIGDPSRKKFLLATSINENGNKNKHSLDKNEVINIEECVHQYNKILKEIASIYNLQEILTLSIKQNQPKKQPVKNIFAEARSIKYDTFDGNDLKFTLSPFYEFDKFKKLATVELAIDWQKESNDDIQVTIYSNKSGSKLLTERFSLSGSHYENLRLPVSVNDLDTNNLLELNVKVQVYRDVKVKKKEKRTYTTGILMWKKYHTYHADVEKIENQCVFNKSIYIGQCLREERTKK